MDQKIIRNLNSVGKAVFVEYFDTFKAYAEGRISKEDCIETLVANGVSNDTGAVIRCSNAKALFDREEEYIALSIVAKSAKTAVTTRSIAERLIME